MTKYENAPESAKAYLNLAEPYIQTNEAGVKYLTPRIRKHLNEQLKTDESMQSTIQTAMGRDAENEVLAAWNNLSKAREKGNPEEVKQLTDLYQQKVDQLSQWINITTAKQRALEQAKVKTAQPTFHTFPKGEDKVTVYGSPETGFKEVARGTSPNEWVDVDLPGGQRVTVKGHQVLDAYTKGGKKESEYKVGAVVDDTGKYYKGQKDALKTTYGSINPVTGQFAVDRDKVKEYQAELNRVQRMEDEDYYLISKGQKPKWLTGHFLREQQQKTQDDAVKSLIDEYSAGY
jgi:hypothetical protein